MSARTADGDGDVVDISDPRFMQKDNRGRTVQVKTVTNGGAGSAVGDVTLKGRIDTTDDDAWITVKDEVTASDAVVTIDATDGGIAIGIFRLAYDFRELRLDLDSFGAADSVDTSIAMGT